MATKSILLKVTPEVHAAIQEAAGRHGRSMQNVLAALIERWLDAGAPDPKAFDVEPAAAAVAAGGGVDHEARRAIEGLANIMIELQEDKGTGLLTKGPTSPGWADRLIVGLQSDLERRGALRDVHIDPLGEGLTPRHFRPVVPGSPHPRGASEVQGGDAVFDPADQQRSGADPEPEQRPNA